MTDRPAAARIAARIEIAGAVQGVGFRPHLHRLAAELGLGGVVRNTAAGVAVEIEGPPGAVDAFIARVGPEAPPLAVVTAVATAPIPPAGRTAFEIRHSVVDGPKSALVLPDIAPCADCLREMADPADRRHRYPFTNCTHCGPRFSIVLGIPYDRANTTMRGFELCAACRAEYRDPADRRFHAQPVACPACGPQLAWWDADGRTRATRDDALRAAVDALRAGGIVAMKGVGGFHLLCDAANPEAVARLRARKHRDEKPFALLYPSLEAVARDARVYATEAALLRAPEAPIVLLARGPGAGALADGVAPGVDTLGAMLPPSPLHHLLAGDFGGPLVATSGNLAEEPLCTRRTEALERLRGIADHFLVHDRPIARPVDDSIARVIDGDPALLRRARGYAPLPVPLAWEGPPVLAVGAHLKGCVALGRGCDVFLSQHLGDLDGAAARDGFERVIGDLEALFDIRPEAVAHDLHPDYAGTRHALATGLPRVPVQHHRAHACALLAERRLDGPILAVSWDGVGLGDDGLPWGGEFFHADWARCVRVAALRAFPLPGGDAAAREPRRAALGLLYAADPTGFLERLPPAWRRAWPRQERAALVRMLERGLQSPRTTSAGRLFDAVAALLGLADRNAYEGQAAMRVEQAAARAAKPRDLPPIALRDAGEYLELDWAPMLDGLLDGLARGVPADALARGFHAALAGAVVAVARRVGLREVGLTGGCFQNALLCAETAGRLRDAGFHPHRHRLVPPNDGGVALGQAAWAMRKERNDVPRGAG